LPRFEQNPKAMSIAAITSLLAPDSELVSSRCPDLDEPLNEVLAAGDRGAIGGLPPEFERLFYAVEALRAGDRPVVLQFTGVAGAEGVTTVASGFARAAAAGHSRPVLFLDGHLGAATGPGPGLIEACRQGRPLAACLAAVEGLPNLRWGRLARGSVGVAGRDAAEIRALLDLARQDHPVVVLDSPGVGVSPVSAALSRLCDGTVLVVQAGKTKAAAIRAAKAEIERFGGQVVGAVLNRQREAAPRWLARFA
jgi:hypothetical protein